MNHELTSFLTRHRACTEGLSRLAVTGSATPEEAWERADASDLIWAVTRPVVMSKMQRRKFLSEAVLAPIEHLLTDARSLNILQKLRANEQITDADRLSAAYAADADADASDASYAAAQAAAERAWAAAAYAAAAEASAAEYAADAADAARAAQARWIRENIKLSDLHIN